MIRRLLYSLHHFLGFVVCLFLSMWFISGLVLIYHPFPNVTPEQKYANQEAIQIKGQAPDITKILSQIPAKEKIKKISLSQFEGQAQFRVRTDKKQHRFPVDSTIQRQHITPKTIEHIASRWSKADILRIDTLQKRDIWIMYNRYEKELPIYKVYFDDPEKHELYISSRTGEVQQFTTSSERFWAYLGAIPHKLYIPALRENSQLWADVVTILSLICLFVGITGLYVGIDAVVKRYKRKQRLESPYKKKAYRWHHIVGILFSLFLITWSISGALSLRRVPQWMAKSYRKVPMGITGKGLSASADVYTLDYNKILAQYQDVKQIEWSYFQGKPVFDVAIGNQSISCDASLTEPQELNLTESDIAKMVKHNHKGSPFKIELINEYDDYYLPWRKTLPLPAYKVSVSDLDKSIYYINPKNGEYKYVNTNRKVRKWLFYGLHYFHIKWLMDKPVLWTIVIWTLTLGCAFVSLTGVWLGGRYFKRKLGGIRRKLSSSNKSKTC